MNMSYIQFSALKCNKFYEKSIKICSPTLRRLGTSVTITIETSSEPTKEYIDNTAKLLEQTPISNYEYFSDVKCIKVQN